MADEHIPSPRGSERWNKRAIETMLTNEKYTGTVIITDSSTPEQMIKATECIPPIITESEFNSVQEERQKRSNVEIDEEGNVHRKNSKYSSKKKTKKPYEP